jgi:hypothetical protein
VTGQETAPPAVGKAILEPAAPPAPATSAAAWTSATTPCSGTSAPPLTRYSQPLA